MKSSFVICTVAGIEIGIHFSWLFAFVIITMFLGMNVYPSSYPQWADTTHWAMGAVTAFALFVSVLAHELAHSLVALAKGIPVRSITLFIFGGVSNLGSDTQRPGDEFQISVAGPVMSLVVGGLALMVWRTLGPVNPRETQPLEAVLFYLGWMNLGVGVFNLLPGLPLDGGRVLRSIVWQATGKMELGTVVAGRAGQFVGWGIVAYGLYVMFLRDNIFNGLWFVFIGWFLAGAASSAVRQTRRRPAERSATDVQVREVMQPNPVVVGPDLAVDELVSECFHRLNCSAAPVLDSGGLTGIVTEAAAQSAGEAAWRRLVVRQIMDSNPVIVGPNDLAVRALKRMLARGATHAVVADGATVVGLLAISPLLRIADPEGGLRSNNWRS